MRFDKKNFLAEINSSPRRKAAPIMSSPGIELVGADSADVFRDGALQFACIGALAERFPADVSVTFMDLSVEAEAFGCAVAFPPGEVPTVTGALASDAAAIGRLAVPAVGAGRTAEVLHCAELCARKLSGPTLCGIIGPYSLAGRIADMTEIMLLAAAEPETAHALLAKTAAFLTDYLRALKATGVAGVLIAEPAAGLLSPEMCRVFSADYLKGIIAAAAAADDFLVVLHNCGRTVGQVGALLSTGADALHVGNAVDILDILRQTQTPAGTPVMGNLDPVGVFKDLDAGGVYAATTSLLERTAGYRGYVLSSGCDLPPGVPMENISAFFRAVADYNQKTGD